MTIYLDCLLYTSFPIVFLIGMEDGIFPSYNSLQSQEELEEERRLAYVGITRAKEQLYLTCLLYTSRCV